MKIKSDFVTNSSSSSFIVVAVPDWFNTSIEKLKKKSVPPMINIHDFTDKHLENLTKIVNDQINSLKECETIRERDCLDAITADAYIITECVLEDFTLAYQQFDFVENDGFIKGIKTEVVDELFLNIHRNEFEKVYEAINK